MCLELRLEVPQLSSPTAEKLRKTLPLIGGSVNNLIDLSLASLVGQDVYGNAIRKLSDEKNIDMLLVISPVGGKHLRDLLLQAVADARAKKPLVVALIARTTESIGLIARC